MNRVECAISCFEEGFSCAQAVLSAYGPQLGLDREMALRVAGAFGGGMGHLGRTCGAVTGAFVVIGLKYGKTRAEDNETRDKAYSLVVEFADRFQSHNGSTVCKELLGYDISIPEEYELAKEKGLFTTLCPKLVRDAAEIIEQMIDEINIRFDERGLIPAVVQDRATGQVLMVAWMNDDALQLTRKTGQAHFWSRSRKELWHKGATSGNFMHVREIWVDCDADTLLLQVDPTGPACHTGEQSCFYRRLS